MSKSSDELKISEEKYSAGTEIERSSKLFMRNLVQIGQRSKILDIGCGTGLNANKMAEAGYNIYGVDLSPTAIEKFNKAGHKGIVHDISHPLPFPDDYFDGVFASEIIEHCVDTDFFLSECKRITKTGGTIYLSTPNSTFWVYRIFALLGQTISEVQHPGHIRFFSIRSLRASIEKIGLDIEKVCGRNMFIILPDFWGKALSHFLGKKILKREMRFKTRKYFWHVSFCANVVSPIWTDTMIFVVIKP